MNHYLDESNSRGLPSGIDNLTLADSFADFFVNKIMKIRQSFNCDGNDNPLLVCNSHCEFSNFLPLSDDDIVKLINDMPCKLNSADPVSLSLLKENLALFVQPLKFIVNLSLQTGVFPDSLKHGRITPILKSKNADPESLSNYRPVTTLPFLSKLLEKAACTQIVSYLEENDLIPLYQSAYLKSHSCETALFKFHNDVQQMLSSGKVVILVQLDLSAAFDTVDHEVLIQLLANKFGVCGIALKWMKSYLTGRSFSLKIGYINGKKVLLIYGVPQGSILGPLLFIIYVSDLPAITSGFDICFQSYADDSQLYTGFDPLSNYSDTMNVIKKCVESIELWMKSKFLKMNVNKTEVLFISKPRMHSLLDMSITIGDKCYASSSQSSVKSLGVYLNGTMSIKTMVSDVVKSCNFNLKKIANFKYILSAKHKLTLVKSHVLNKLDYCSILLVNAPFNQINRLQAVINKAVRFIHLLKKRDSLSSFLKDDHILPMRQRIMYKSCVFVHNMLYENCPHYMKNVLQRRLPSEFNLRSNNDSFILCQSTDSNTLQYGMIRNWNSLPHALRSISCIEPFKKHLKTHYFNIVYN